MKHELVPTESCHEQDDNRPFVYHTEHDGDIVFNEPTTARSSQPVVTNEQCADFTRT